MKAERCFLVGCFLWSGAEQVSIYGDEVEQEIYLIRKDEPSRELPLKVAALRSTPQGVEFELLIRWRLPATANARDERHREEGGGHI